MHSSSFPGKPEVSLGLGLALIHLSIQSLLQAGLPAIGAQGMCELN